MTRAPRTGVTIHQENASWRNWYVDPTTTAGTVGPDARLFKGFVRAAGNGGC
jgi:hypothetical protein